MGEVRGGCTKGHQKPNYDDKSIITKQWHNAISQRQFLSLMHFLSQNIRFSNPFGMHLPLYDGKTFGIPSILQQGFPQVNHTMWRPPCSLLVSIEPPWLAHANPAPHTQGVPGFILCYIPHVPAFFPVKTPDVFACLHGKDFISYHWAWADLCLAEWKLSFWNIALTILYTAVTGS